MLRNKGFWDKNASIFDPVYFENNKHFEKHYITKFA